MLEIIKKHRHYILFLGLITTVFWTWLVPGPRVANDLPMVSMDSLVEQFNIPRIWQDRGDGLGEYSVFTLWSWPMTFLSGTLAKLGINFAIQERIVFIFPTILIGAFGIFKILSDLKLSKSAMLVSTFFYLTNTYVILLIDGGQLSVSLTYAFFPLVFWLVTNSISKGLKNKLLAGVAISFLGFLDIRFIYVLFILLVAFFTYHLLWLMDQKKLEYLKNILISGFIFIVILITLHFYWLFPLVKFPLSSDVYSTLTSSSGLNFTKLSHAFLLLSPHWPLNVFGKVTPILPEFILIPVLVFLAPVFAFINKNKNLKTVFFWVIIAGVSVFITKGGNTPLPELYPWLYKNIPGFSLFRDSTKFFFLVALSYSILTAFTVDFLVRKFNFKLIIPVLISTYYLLLISPVWRGQMTGMFNKPSFQKEFEKTSSILKDDKYFSRVLWISAKAPLSYSSPIHPGVEASRLRSIRPFATGIVGTYEVNNFLREASYMGQLLDVFSINYLSYPYPDPRREDLKEDTVDYYHSFSTQLETLDWIYEKVSDFPVNTYKTEGSKDQFFITPNTWLIVGSDRIYEEFNYESGNKLSENALIFAEENLDSKELLLKPEFKPLLYKSPGEIFLPFEKYIFISDFIGSEPSSTHNNAVITNNGWWKREAGDFLWLRSFLEQKYALGYQEFTYQKGVAISEGNDEIVIDKNLIDTDKIFYARVLFSSKGGKIKFIQGDQIVGEINTKNDNFEKVSRKLTGFGEIPDQYFEYDEAVFTTLPIGKINNLENLKIITEGEINMVNFIAPLAENTPKQEVEILAWDTLTVPEREVIFRSNSSPNVSYKKLSTTHYKVNVSGIDKPMTLVFSQRYDKNWKLNGKASYPVYSALNGFSITKDGEYDVYFEPQRLVSSSLIVSTVGASAIGVYFLYTFFSVRKNTKTS